MEWRCEWISTRNNYIPYLFVLPDISDHSIEFFRCSLVFAFKPLSFPCAVAAINRTKACNIHKNPIRVTVCESFDWGIIFLIEGVGVSNLNLYLFGSRHSLFSYRVIRIFRAYEGKIIRG